MATKTGVLNEVYVELARATEQYGPFNSLHEAFAVMYEEVDELWEVVRMKNYGDQTKRRKLARKEAIQVAAMAVRLVMDCCEGKE